MLRPARRIFDAQTGCLPRIPAARAGSLPAFRPGHRARHPADFSLTDQYGRTWTREDLAGKTVFLNLWTTWCPWCIREMPDIEALWHELGENQGDVLILGLASPSLYDTVDEAGIAAFLQEQGFTYPVLMDTDFMLCSALGIEAFPTTWLFTPDGRLHDTQVGAMDKAAMERSVNPAVGGNVDYSV